MVLGFEKLSDNSFSFPSSPSQTYLTDPLNFRLKKSLPQMLADSIVITSESGAQISYPILLEDGRRPYFLI